MRSFKLALGFMLTATAAVAQTYPSPTFNKATIIPTLPATLPSSTLGYTPLGMLINIPSDNSAQTSFTPGQKLPSAFYLSYFFGGSNVNNGRNGINAECGLTAATSSSNAYKYYVCNNAYIHTSTNDGGTSANYTGVQEGITSQAILNTGATYYEANIGIEIANGIQTGASAKINA
jgi:hypothetical protein